MNCDVRVAVHGMLNSLFPIDFKAGRSLSKRGEAAVWHRLRA